jgi:hypothetical protein
MRKLPRWKRDCYIRNTTTGHVERRIHGDADFMVKHGWILTTRAAWQEYERDRPQPIPERKLQGALVPAVKSGVHFINGVLATVTVSPTVARESFSTAKNVITDWKAQQDADNERYQKALALHAEQQARQDHKCRVRLAEELAQISRAQEAARKIHAEHPPIQMSIFVARSDKSFHQARAASPRRPNAPSRRLRAGYWGWCDATN